MKNKNYLGIEEILQNAKNKRLNKRLLYETSVSSYKSKNGVVLELPWL